MSKRLGEFGGRLTVFQLAERETLVERSVDFNEF